MRYLLDTCALIWWTLDPQHLSPAAASACQTIEARGDGVISSITIWEIGIKVKTGKLDLGMTVEDYHRRLSEMSMLDIVAVDDRTWLRNVALDWEHRDPADRTIVALALLRGFAIITSDERIKSFYPRTVW